MRARSGTWQLQEAKNRLSEVVNKAIQDGPQIITRRGVETAIVLSLEDYKRLARPKTSLVDFFRRSPLHGVELEIERSRDTPREVDL